MNSSAMASRSRTNRAQYRALFTGARPSATVYQISRLIKRSHNVHFSRLHCCCLGFVPQKKTRPVRSRPVPSRLLYRSVKRFHSARSACERRGHPGRSSLSNVERILCLAYNLQRCFYSLFLIPGSQHELPFFVGSTHFIFWLFCTC